MEISRGWLSSAYLLAGFMSNSNPGYNVAERLILPVNRLVREDPANAASRVRHIAFVAWDNVDMQMKDGLTCCQTVVDAYIETVGRKFFEKCVRACCRASHNAATSSDCASKIEAIWRFGMISVWPGETGSVSLMVRV